MTKEQIDKLRVGDVIRAEYAVAAEDLSAFTLVSPNGTRHRATRTGHNPILDAASLVVPEPAAAPCPVIEAGDTVRVIPDQMTRTVYGAADERESFRGELCLVLDKVDKFGDVLVCLTLCRNKRQYINIHCLELVNKAVKDKYAVRYCYVGGAWTWCKIVTLGDEETVASFRCSHYPNAKDTAEAECARLNAEWRKQQEGGAE